MYLKLSVFTCRTSERGVGTQAAAAAAAVLGEIHGQRPWTARARRGAYVLLRHVRLGLDVEDGRIAFDVVPNELILVLKLLEHGHLARREGIDRSAKLLALLLIKEGDLHPQRASRGNAA